MKRLISIISTSLVVMALGLDVALADQISKPGGMLTCTGPISDKDTGESLYERFGKDAGLNTFQDANSDSFVVVELFSFGDANLIVRLRDADFVKAVAAVEVWSETTAWSAFGVKNGMNIEQVTAINGRPFKIYSSRYSLDADGGFAGGRLDKLEGGCRLKITFAVSDSVKLAKPIGINGLSSDDPDLLKVHPLVYTMTLTWPRK